MAGDDEYELLPHKEIEELKEELARLKEFEIAPSKKLQVSLLEVNKKLDKIITIFEDAAHEMRVEEGSLRFKEKMSPVLDRMNKIVEQNAELAQGILAIADMLKEKGIEAAPPKAPAGLPPLPSSAGAPREAPEMPQDIGLPPPGVPPAPTGQPAGLEAAANAQGQQTRPGQGLPLPPLPKRRSFGL